MAFPKRLKPAWVALCLLPAASQLVLANTVFAAPPPPPISLVRTTVDFANGMVKVTGRAGSVDPGATVTVARPYSIRCTINRRFADISGLLNSGSTLACTNKPEGADADVFTIRSNVTQNCANNTLISVVTRAGSVGSGETATSNNELQVKFIGHITANTTTSLTICEATTLSYEVVAQPFTRSTVAGADGAFTVTLPAQAADTLSIVVADSQGNTSTLPGALGKPVPAAMSLPVLADPAAMGPYPVGTLELDDRVDGDTNDTGILFSDLGYTASYSYGVIAPYNIKEGSVNGVACTLSKPCTNASCSVASPCFITQFVPINRVWARIMYPAVSDGSAAPLPENPRVPDLKGLLYNAPVDGRGPFPVVLFLHGNHITCDYNHKNWTDFVGAHKYNNEFYDQVCDPQHWSDAGGAHTRSSDDLRIPNHEGYIYLARRLASQGMFVISINAQQFIKAGASDKFSEFILRVLDMLRKWNTAQIYNQPDLVNGAAKYPVVGLSESSLRRDMFYGKLDLAKVGLVGHSIGGGTVLLAENVNAKRPSATRHNILAVNAIAPAFLDAYATHSAFFLLQGARDGDIRVREGFKSYDGAYRNDTGLGVNAREKMAALVYGANHNYFNTIWTDEADNEVWSGGANPWAGGSDDWVYTLGYPDCDNHPNPCDDDAKISAKSQRQAAIYGIVPFFRWQLQQQPAYRQVLTGAHRFGTFNADVERNLYWSFQDSQRKALDNFEQWSPQDLTAYFQNYNYIGMNSYQNTQGGGVTPIDFTDFGECPVFLCNGTSAFTSVEHTSTFGMRLAWAAAPGSSAWYLSNVTAPHNDVSGYQYLSVRVAQRVPLTGVLANAGPELKNVRVSVYDGSRLSEVSTERYALIPYPFPVGSSAQSSLVSVRIPLAHFTLNDSGVDLKNIQSVFLRAEGSGQIVIDDIEFGN